MNLMESGASFVTLEFANSAKQDEQAGVHISVSQNSKPLNLFLNLEQAAKLLLQLQRSLTHAYTEASELQRTGVERIAAHEDAIAKGLAVMGHGPGPQDTLNFLTGKRA